MIERAHIRVGTSQHFINQVLLIPCAAESPQGIAIAIDPRYDSYDLAKFYAQHQQQGDLAVCIQRRGNITRYLLTIRKGASVIYAK